MFEFEQYLDLLKRKSRSQEVRKFESIKRISLKLWMQKYAASYFDKKKSFKARDRKHTGCADFRLRAQQKVKTRQNKALHTKKAN